MEPWTFKPAGFDESIDNLPQREDEEINFSQFATFMHQVQPDHEKIVELRNKMDSQASIESTPPILYATTIAWCCY